MKKLVGVRIEEEVWNYIQKRAIDLNISNSELVENALKKFLGG